MVKKLSLPEALVRLIPDFPLWEYPVIQDDGSGPYLNLTNWPYDLYPDPPTQEQLEALL